MSTGPSPADLLSAASLLLAALAVLYGVWYSSIEEARILPLPNRKDDAIKPLAQVRGILRGRAYPLAVASGLATAVFAPEAISICATTIDSFADRGLGAFSYYDPIEAALLLVTVGLAVLTLHVGHLCHELRKKLSDGEKLPV